MWRGVDSGDAEGKLDRLKLGCILVKNQAPSRYKLEGHRRRAPTVTGWRYSGNAPAGILYVLAGVFFWRVYDYSMADWST